ncbi:CBS domain-containing protein [Lysobacter niastensis]|uniref:CBS domain-containing protein n=2 Tax=Lysobacter niastensis TaxID=380629 RepID=A0ABS0B8N8_9GAMM|nr:CBS domain-containing protein [Lysobacter niastensis]
MTRDPVSCHVDTPLPEVAAMMLSNDCGQIPVVDAEGRPLGVITDRDIVVRVIANGGNPATGTAADAMTSPAKTVSTKTTLTDCVHMMEEAQIRRVPVVDDRGHLIGIVATADVALSGKRRAIADVMEEVSAPAAHRAETRAPMRH